MTEVNACFFTSAVKNDKTDESQWCEWTSLIMGANTGLISTAGAPFGGVKESGVGREGGKHGMDEYLDVKYLCMSGVGS